ncbi:MAG: hypothetical protein ACKOWH_01320 [Rhodoluna sp.]
MSQKFNQRILAAIAALGISLSLTACDPPMPPDVAAQILEQTYTCQEGAARVKFPSLMSDLAPQWGESLAGACVDPEPAMNLEADNGDSEANIEIGAYPVSEKCQPLVSVPFALETADLVFQMADYTTLSLRPATVAKILNGEITNWNDVAISKDNDGSEFPDLNIKIYDQADELALTAFSSWMKNLGQDISQAAIKSSGETIEAPALQEGDISIMPHSAAVTAGLYSASVILGKDKNTGEVLYANSDPQGVGSAASQLEAQKSENKIGFELNPKIAPVAQAGFDTASPPYQAIYSVNLTICGEDKLVNRAVALFLLRLDSQGMMGTSAYNPLPEQVRVEALSMVGKGLPKPKANKAE